jgi:hypothetical protein
MCDEDCIYRKLWHDALAEIDKLRHDRLKADFETLHTLPGDVLVIRGWVPPDRKAAEELHRLVGVPVLTFEDPDVTVELNGRNRTAAG